jgi:hypothetical protein
MHASGGERALMYAPGGGMTYNRVYISMSLCIYIYMPTSRGLQKLLDWISILGS